MNSLFQYSLSFSILAAALAALVICLLVMRAGFSARSHVKAEIGRRVARRGHGLAGALFVVAAVLAVIGLSVSPARNGIPTGSEHGPSGLRTMDEQIGKVEPLVDRMRRGVGLILVRVESLWQAAVPDAISRVPNTIVARVSEVLSQRAESPRRGRITGLPSAEPGFPNASPLGPVPTPPDSINGAAERTDAADSAAVRTDAAERSEQVVPDTGAPVATRNGAANGGRDAAVSDPSVAPASNEAVATVYRNGGPSTASNGGPGGAGDGGPGSASARTPGPRSPQQTALINRGDPPVDRGRAQRTESAPVKPPVRIEKPQKLEYPWATQKDQKQVDSTGSPPPTAGAHLPSPGPVGQLPTAAAAVNQSSIAAPGGIQSPIGAPGGQAPAAAAGTAVKTESPRAASSRSGASDVPPSPLNPQQGTTPWSASGQSAISGRDVKEFKDGVKETATSPTLGMSSPQTQPSAAPAKDTAATQNPSPAAAKSGAGVHSPVPPTQIQVSTPSEQISSPVQQSTSTNQQPARQAVYGSGKSSDIAGGKEVTADVPAAKETVVTTPMQQGASTPSGGYVGAQKGSDPSKQTDSIQQAAPPVQNSATAAVQGGTSSSSLTKAPPESKGKPEPIQQAAVPPVHPAAPVARSAPEPVIAPQIQITTPAVDVDSSGPGRQGTQKASLPPVQVVAPPAAAVVTAPASPSSATPKATSAPVQIATPAPAITLPAPVEKVTPLSTPRALDPVVRVIPSATGPAKIETPARIDTPVKIEAPAKMETPAKIEAPAKIDGPKADVPKLDKLGKVEVAPSAPVQTITPPATPPVLDPVVRVVPLPTAPAKIDSPARIQTPAKIDVPKVEAPKLDKPAIEVPPKAAKIEVAPPPRIEAPKVEIAPKPTKIEVAPPPKIEAPKPVKVEVPKPVKVEAPPKVEKPQTKGGK